MYTFSSTDTKDITDVVQLRSRLYVIELLWELDIVVSDFTYGATIEFEGTDHTGYEAAAVYAPMKGVQEGKGKETVRVEIEGNYVIKVDCGGYPTSDDGPEDSEVALVKWTLKLK
jgi:hypothetical protein